MRKVFLSTVAITALAAGAASAATYNEVDIRSGISVGGAFNPTLGTLSVDPFDQSLGTLNFATYVMSFSIASEGSFTNTGDQELLDFTVELTGQGSLSNADFTPTSVSALNTESSTPVDLAPDETVPFSLTTSESGSGSVLFALANGASPIDVDFSLAAGVDTSGGSSFDSSVTTLGEVSLDVTYDYTPSDTPEIPVPAALPLLASALGVFGVARYRRRK
ncbi:MAG: choice-of-anchor E domain-containing protein [Pseudomonadota bacterium]